MKYSPIPVIFNGERINVDTMKEKWTEVTDEAYIKITPISRTLTIYNQGIFVCHEDASSYGAGGIVVSRKALEVNFARNAVIKSACPVWKAIRPVLAKHIEKLSSKKKERMTDSWRAHKVKEMLSWDGNPVGGKDFVNAPCFTDVSGKHWSLEKLSCQQTITMGQRSSLVADRLHAAGQAVVLDEAVLAQYCRPVGFMDLLKHLQNPPMNVGYTNYASRVASAVMKRMVEFETLAASVSNEHHVLTEKELSKSQAATLRAINQLQNRFVWRLSRALHSDETFRVRRVGAMKSETAEAITDGRAAIYLRTDFLNGATNGPSMGFSWAVKVINLLVHEYLHDFNSGIGHTHDAEFYELYHQATQDRMLAFSATELFGEYVSGLKKLTPTAARFLNATAIVEDWFGRAPSPPETDLTVSPPEDAPRADGSPASSPADFSEDFFQNALPFAEG